MSEFSLLRQITSPLDIKGMSMEQLEQLAQELRTAICEQVARTGGHLAPNLGVIELTLALHYVFDFGHDRLLFDVGHQCYPHKLITGRFDKLDRLRTREGIAGFPEPRESPYDLFSVGHAGTGISTAIGMARGDQLNGQDDRKVVTLVGDSSIVNGLAFEGLNNAGTLKRQFLVVLNDNGMSIGQPQGALAGYFDKIRIHPRYSELKHRVHEVLKKLPAGATLEEIYHRLGEMTKAALAHTPLFEHFGLLSVGPIDGHDLPHMIDMLNEVKRIDYPVLLHVKTVKGKGFEFSSDDPTTFHSPKPFTVQGCRAELIKSGRSFTAAYADAMIDLMDQDDKVVAVTAGMPDGTGLADVMRKHPDRTFDVGIAEEHATDMCAGMAKAGMKPFNTIYSTFMQRGIDQVFQEVALQGLPVRLCMDRGGLVGGDGAVHHGFLDIALLRGFPKMVLMAVHDEPTLRAALAFMRDYQDGPTAVRYPRDNVPETTLADSTPAFELGKANALAAGTDVAVLAYGFPVNHALKARQTLEQEGISVGVFDARFAKPIDIDLVQLLIEAETPIVTVEDHHVIGGFGACVLEACNERRLPTDNIHRLGLPDRWIYQGSRGEQQAEAGIDADGIAAKVREIMAARKASPRRVPVGSQTVPRPSFGTRIIRAVGGKSDS